MTLAERSKKWLAQDVLPLWLKKGVDWKKGGFIECLNLHGETLEQPRRAMVQARQIYSLRIAIELDVCDLQASFKATQNGADFLIDRFSLPSGAFIHSVDNNGKPHNLQTDLYTQAFALFGLAHAFALSPRPTLKDRAIELVSFLERERRVKAGGFLELGDQPYQSNPHMHLFEAFIAWMEVDKDPKWRTLATETLDLCLNHFIDPKVGALAEYFDENWKPQLSEGKFIFEPGHQFEWSWLMGRYQRLTSLNLLPTRLQLFELSDKVGIAKDRKTAIDQVWSDFSPKSESSRFWPQCERVKAASQLFHETQDSKFAHARDEALTALFYYFETPTPGLWFDSWGADKQFSIGPAKASSLYHIIGSISEYLLNS